MKHTWQNDILKAASVRFEKWVRLTTWENNISCKQAVYTMLIYQCFLMSGNPRGSTSTVIHLNPSLCGNIAKKKQNKITYTVSLVISGALSHVISGTMSLPIFIAASQQLPLGYYFWSRKLIQIHSLQTEVFTTDSINALLIFICLYSSNLQWNKEIFIQDKFACCC